MNATTTIRYIDQYSEDITVDDAIALCTGEALPLWKDGINQLTGKHRHTWTENAMEWVPCDEDGILYYSYDQCDTETWEATIEEYSLTLNNLADLMEEFQAEAIAEMEDDLEDRELAELENLSEYELAELVADETAEKLADWLEEFQAASLEAYSYFSCPLDAWEMMTESI